MIALTFSFWTITHPSRRTTTRRSKPIQCENHPHSPPTDCHENWCALAHHLFSQIKNLCFDVKAEVAIWCHSNIKVNLLWSVDMIPLIKSAGTLRCQIYEYQEEFDFDKIYQSEFWQPQLQGKTHQPNRPFGTIVIIITGLLTTDLVDFHTHLRYGYGASLGGPLCHTHNPILRLFSRTCLHMTSDDDQTRPHKKHKQHDKQHHHGGGTARPSSGVDLMNPCRWRGERPSAYFFQCHCWSDLRDSRN